MTDIQYIREYGVTPFILNTVDKMLSEEAHPKLRGEVFHELGLINKLCLKANGQLRSRQIIAAVVAKHLIS